MGPIMASKQQDIEILELDSWEEIDETDVLEKKLSKLIMPTISGNSLNGVSNNAPIQITITGEDALRSQYVPPEPTVKILKRPTKDAKGHRDLKKAVPKKTLQQREQEYAEARLRILGESGSDRPEERISIAKPRNSEFETAKPSASEPEAIKLRNTEGENIVRLPKGPDGTNGFSFRR
ncbi:SUZ domain-containing protein 1 [Cylas formicarius]|uniref:SUZ domain-containing protein 1 n=1 Tax=Cylas formicarius TaxID=197179 RepID=UPI0029588ABF|nr:SUZ domain-containing protein 1 [Cylas formicarius]